MGQHQQRSEGDLVIVRARTHDAPRSLACLPGCERLGGEQGVDRGSEESRLRRAWKLVLCRPVSAGPCETHRVAEKFCAGGRLQQETREKRVCEAHGSRVGRAPPRGVSTFLPNFVLAQPLLPWRAADPCGSCPEFMRD